MTKVDLFRIHTAILQHTLSTTRDHVNLPLFPQPRRPPSW